MPALRPLSARPELLVSDHAWQVYDPATGTLVGIPGPFGRERVVYALPTDGGYVAGPVSKVLHDEDGFYLADSGGNLIGATVIWIPRLLHARWAEDTRRLP